MHREVNLEKREAIPGIGYYPQEPISTGTTLIAVQFPGGVVVGTDARTSTGSFVASRVTDKITPITDHLVVCRSGSAADTQAIADIAKYHIEFFSTMEDEQVSIYRSSQIFRKYLYDYREQLSASMIVAGWDAHEGGQIYTIPLGGFVSRQRFTASGSGSTFVTGFLDRAWRKDMTLEEVKQLVMNAVALAMFRDGSSGGVIRLAIIDENGTQRELYRPDTNTQFPMFETPTPYQFFPKHIEQHPVE
ncbi:unnamed protein product [Bursaphelenchus okinawaensis]|uniref:Proteasome subunit beta n=1 Tax=Bursaphelenchus okinawaensis TaxID=465554 RepID=A0A811KR02_9BILA|nr:unnamed protein product [Bursaphelenchus okinawaensis]CAG9112152.1 unnamed protein product [Bursaphelenchus okinawaensis]